MGKKDLIDAYRGKWTEFPPWVPYSGIHSGYIIGERADQYIQNADLIAKGVVTTAKRYKADGLPLMFDLTLEAEALGCELKWFPDNVPLIVTHLCSDKNPYECGLEPPSRDAGRYPVMFRAAEICKPALDEIDCAMMGFVSGPLTLASHLAGVRIFTDVINNTVFAEQILRFAGEVTAVSAQYYVEMGCDIISIVDPLASQLKSEAFRKYVTPHVQKAIEVIHSAGRTSTFFICGDCSIVLEDVCKIGTHGIAVDEQMNLLYVREMAGKYGVGFSGNLKLTMSLSLGLIPPREDALICLASGGQTGFILAPGCDLLYDIPVQHIEQVIEARDWYYHYYTQYPGS